MPITNTTPLRLFSGLRLPRVYFRRDSVTSTEAGTTPVVLSVSDVLARLPISKSMLYDLIRSKQLESIKLGRRRFIPADALPALIVRLRDGGAS